MNVEIAAFPDAELHGLHNSLLRVNFSMNAEKPAAHSQ
jgi:hypothetical protein